MTPFLYQDKPTPLHNLDPRCKLAMLCLTSIAAINADLPALAIVSTVMICLIKTAGISFSKALRSLKLFFLLLLFVFLSRALTTPGDTLISVLQFKISTQGIRQGLTISWRFLLVMVMGMLFSHTTKPASVKSAVQWILKPFPFVPGKKAGLMIGLAARFLPLILLQAKEVSDAQQARCANLQKNPVKRISKLVASILKKSFHSADKLAIAMAARSFSEERTDPEFTPSGHEIFASAAAILIALVLVFC